MKRNIFIVIFVVSSGRTHGLSPVKFVSDSWAQYCAHSAYQARDVKTAQTEYAKLLVDQPYDAQANYNLGVTLYQQKQYQDAKTYFDRCVSHAPSQGLLREQALFNRGNSFVQLEKLSEAIQDYQRVLQMNPNNQAAKNNLQMVQQMLQEPPKQDQKNSDKSDNKDQKKSDGQQDQKKSGDQGQNSQDQQSQPDGSQLDGSQQDKSESQESKSDRSQQEKNKAQEQQSKGNKDADKQQGKQQAEQKQEEQTEEQQVDGLQKTKEKEAGADGKQSGKEEHDKKHGSSSKGLGNQQSTDSDQVGKEDQEQEAILLDDALAKELLSKLEDDDRLDKRSTMLLEKLDNYEKDIQKKLLQMNVTKQGAKQYGQKNW